MRRIRSSCWLPPFLAIFFIIGVGLIVRGAIILKDASVSKEWPTTQGEITGAFVREDRDDDGTTYHADVSYEYVVDDRRYTTDTVNFGQYGTSNPDHAEGVVNRYPVGKTVLVYYDPASPETAVLEPGVTWSSYFVMGIGFIFALIPMLILVISGSLGFRGA